jgi:unsaturated rhamnogalacturonyl hydrolase
MMNTTRLRSFMAGLALSATCPIFAQAPAGPAPKPAPAVLAEVTVRNDADFARTETVEVKSADIPGLAKISDLAKVHVEDAATGKEVLAQGVDTNGDYDDDVLVFQVELPAKASARFRLTLREARKYQAADFRVYGRFVRERFDDFGWENDKVAHRMYGEALETWEREPLTSSSVDVWVKKTKRLAINDWYLVDDYHKDHGEGGDFFAAGKSRGCGGTGLMIDGKLFVSKNFRKSRVLAHGPIRLVFELTYDAWDVAGTKVSEVKRVTLDAGSNFNKFESVYRTESGAPLPDSVLWATGLKKEKEAQIRQEQGLIRSWQELNAYAHDGFMGCAIMVDPSRAVATSELDGNILLSFRGPVPFYAGTGWDRSGDFKTMADFDAYVASYARRLASPLVVEVAKK